MIRLLMGGYHKEDVEWLEDIASRITHSISLDCSTKQKKCPTCPNRRACLDLYELKEFLEKSENKLK